MLADAVNALDPTATEGVPPWLIYVGATVGTPLVGVLVLYLRRLLRVEEPTERVTPAEAPQPPQGAAGPMSPAAPQTTAVPTPDPDPEFALIREMVVELREDLRTTRTALTDAEERHRATMAAAEERHRRSMSEVTAALADRERTISRLEATIDAITGRTPPPPGSYPPPPPRRHGY